MPLSVLFTFQRPSFSAVWSSSEKVKEIIIRIYFYFQFDDYKRFQKLCRRAFVHFNGKQFKRITRFSAEFIAFPIEFRLNYTRRWTLRIYTLKHFREFLCRPRQNPSAELDAIIFLIEANNVGQKEENAN